jgi:hypothetical protein
MRAQKQPYLSHQSHIRIIFWDSPLSGEMLLLPESLSLDANSVLPDFQI